MRLSLLIGSALLVGCSYQRGYAPSAPPYPYPPPHLAPGAYPSPPIPVAPGAYPPPPPHAPAPGAWQPLPAPLPHKGLIAVAHARSLEGRPYCWGGTGPDCYDCSGLTYTSWSAAGVAIPRTSDAQRAKLPQVPMSQLQPGDILWRPGHVGLYVGDGWAIHAPGSGKRVTYQPANTFRSAHRPSG